MPLLLPTPKEVGQSLEPAIEIVFATDGCAHRSLWGFVALVAILSVAMTFVVLWQNRTQNALPGAGPFPARLDRLAVYSFVGLIACLVIAMAFFGAMAQNLSKLVASGDTIEVTGCRLARSFRSVFDRSQMSTTYLTVHEKGGTHRYLVLKQDGQRKVTLPLGDHATDRKLSVLAPEAMKLYFEDRQ